MSTISEATFVDLYLGDGFADVKGLPDHPPRAPAPGKWFEEIQVLRERCQEHYTATQEPEFSLIHEGVVFRVTQLSDLNNKSLFVLSKSAVKILPLDDLGLSDELHDALLSQALRGLIFICGEMGSGKTSSAASLVKARLEKWGGMALTIEDPPEPLLHGVHGEGRCVQVPVSRRHGGYEEALIRALRTRAEMILVGEVRDTPTAAQVVQASINGHFIICTGHSGSVMQGIERLAVLAQPVLPNALQILAQGLIAVIHQTLLNDGSGFKRLKLQCLSLASSESNGIREKIRSDKMQLLEQDIASQAARSLWNDQ
ncbi:twitching motility protein PilT [Pseudomonas protegens]|jgi:twitching motility protein PilT|uniref:Twitching motility protein n=2 Tax=Pseudomonas protegens TaxID=380021 RepID=Q4K7L9_PSEF5|nr:ATPase, T2SS/T4P/T4SS family [Pseudomonas protegens]AAY96283.2 twitching motility protein [Pseudomonas protegens Pf-5]ASE21918.1 twitching motility protein PilT [Pseudomonas protegens]OBZ20245.1 twitching motility protein PilT [Pseudomonas protegens]OBZ21348.1 twitching motility protein PilT [Pseudomonas protegens]OKK40622.1 twitching motility protein PilT [Pseudomonas protegens]